MQRIWLQRYKIIIINSNSYYEYQGSILTLDQDYEEYTSTNAVYMYRLKHQLTYVIEFDAVLCLNLMLYFVWTQYMYNINKKFSLGIKS